MILKVSYHKKHATAREKHTVHLFSATFHSFMLNIQSIPLFYGLQKGWGGDTTLGLALMCCCVGWEKTKLVWFNEQKATDALPALSSRTHPFEFLFYTCRQLRLWIRPRRAHRSLIIRFVLHTKTRTSHMGRINVRWCRVASESHSSLARMPV